MDDESQKMDFFQKKCAGAREGAYENECDVRAGADENPRTLRFANVEPHRGFKGKMQIYNFLKLSKKFAKDGIFSKRIFVQCVWTKSYE